MRVEPRESILKALLGLDKIFEAQPTALEYLEYPQLAGVRYRLSKKDIIDDIDLTVRPIRCWRPEPRHQCSLWCLRAPASCRG